MGLEGGVVNIEKNCPTQILLEEVANIYRLWEYALIHNNRDISTSPNHFSIQANSAVLLAQRLFMSWWIGDNTGGNHQRYGSGKSKTPNICPHAKLMHDNLPLFHDRDTNIAHAQCEEKSWISRCDYIVTYDVKLVNGIVSTSVIATSGNCKKGYDVYKR